MLKRTRETVRAVAETLGALSPNLPDATAAAEEHQRSLIVAQNTREAAEQSLQTAHDRNADDGEIVSLEAALAAAKVDESRAEARYRGAENRLQRASDNESSRMKAAARVRLADALAIRKNAAANIDRLAAELAVQAEAFDSQLGVLNECARDGVATHDGRTTSQALVEHALQRAGALQSHWVGNRADQPSAVELAARDQGAIIMPQAVAA